MSQQLINLSPDLHRLQAEGYEVEVRGGYVLVHHVPYVNSEKQIGFGALVSTLLLSGNRTGRPDTHVLHWIGDHPCNKDGSKISAIVNASNRTELVDGITIDHTFSNKPPGGYTDYYAKMSRYADIISAPAKSFDPTLTEKTFLRRDTPEHSVFQYVDTNTSRANIDAVNARLSGQKIGIVGLGGTGSYILDLLAKSPVAEIDVFDGDLLFQHNAFRAPGAASLEQLAATPKKVDYYAGIYSNMHKNIVPHPYYLGEGNVSELDSLTFVFTCLDKNDPRRLIMAHLLNAGIPFIDTGLGVQAVDNALIAQLRVTTGTPSRHDHLASRIPMHDREDDIYASNIQIAELNMMTAALAVMKWKKMCGFYHDHIQYHNVIYTVNSAHFDTTDVTA